MRGYKHLSLPLLNHTPPRLITRPHTVHASDSYISTSHSKVFHGERLKYAQQTHRRCSAAIERHPPGGKGACSFSASIITGEKKVHLPATGPVMLNPRSLSSHEPIKRASKLNPALFKSHVAQTPAIHQYFSIHTMKLLTCGRS